MLHPQFRPVRLSKFQRWRMSRLLVRERKIQQERRKIDSSLVAKRRADAWAYAFLEYQSLLHPKKGEGLMAFRWRAGLLINELPPAFRERAREMFLLTKAKWNMDEKQVQIGEKRLMLKYGLKRVR